MEKIFYYYDTISTNLMDENLYLFYFDSENKIISTSKCVNKKNIGEYIDNKKIYYLYKKHGETLNVFYSLCSNVHQH